MTASVEEALSIFKKWEDEKSRVRVIFRSFLIGGFFTGTVKTATRSTIAIFSEDKPEDGSENKEAPSGMVSVSLETAVSFGFIDPREGGDDRKLLESEMTFGVTVSFASGERCTWYGLPSDI